MGLYRLAFAALLFDPKSSVLASGRPAMHACHPVSDPGVSLCTEPDAGETLVCTLWLGAIQLIHRDRNTRPVRLTAPVCGLASLHVNEQCFVPVVEPVMHIQTGDDVIERRSQPP